MTPEEAKRHVAAQDAELAALEKKIAELATTNSNFVLMAIVRELVDTACGAQGKTFLVLNKIRFYRNVLFLLAEKGIS